MLPGVGEVTAYHIVRFREQIGGFKAIVGLQRVPEVGTTLWSRIQPYLMLTGPSDLRVLIDLNSASQATLERLPGISRHQAQGIIAYRERNGGFQRLKELLLVGGMDDHRLDELRELLTVLPLPPTH